MKKILFIACSAIFFISAQAEAQTSKNKLSKSDKAMAKETIYQFKVEDLSGDTFDFASLKGKKILIVNTASKCGLTPQYKDLEAVYKEYKDKGFVIVGFPANNFASQEPGTNKEIETFCQQNYGVTFPMMNKVSVKGDDMCDVYKFLTQKSKNGLQDSEVEWNFQKYLINEKGELVKVIKPRTLVTEPEVINWIKS
ncbi:glutathione peroxidase [Flavobacterium johnsoniae]|jgi:glutathione peroxidase|uniref:Glutathione peroxidase n=1 Tax=Flavobacterium johnsoniae (strain ATCC 17061 / DSM 2064 / JCM 8514 / BCRC 14874 / CCUG 350202 / NBRC 14942 / NCIMB 11054 / UW101) TaxID=376686 RepID=A5FFP8_FLAJ1|nr:glutathione peroxidase [Flavobacterium johnsoniae]ABQ05965.1 glutathione peroxidase [Flavobacterium johnsoniae UW101]OXE95471.1 glutathione peroxidase [Flavobacterium johnsoniae UW101]WQG81703.1 glutathione peroxidase [Flavobacterium johnsoniae UW101]SHK61559.1 glutathione peroxidase [Flavobacterium johnsoniae]